MKLWSALQNAMRTRRTRWIGRTEADRLVAGNPPGPDHRGLGVLLEAAKAPPSVEELTGESAAVFRFGAAFRSTAAGPPASNRVRVRRSTRVVAVKVAAAVAVLAAGGTALAAETGNLPTGVQHFFSPLYPASDDGPQPTLTGGGPAPSGSSASPARPSPTPAPPRGGATTRPAETAAIGLCRVWDDARTDPHGKAIPAASRRALAAAAGGEKHIADFCADLLATTATATPSQPTTASSMGSGQSSGNGNAADNSNAGGNGNGNAGGNGNGDGDGSQNGNGKGQPLPTPTERDSHHP
jgi:hypothetical protein